MYSLWDKMLYKEKTGIVKQLIQKTTALDNKIIIDYYLNNLMVVCKDEQDCVLESGPSQSENNFRSSKKYFVSADA